MTPKTYARIARLRRAVALATAARDPAWSAIAQAAGYFDQAYMIDEFRTFTGRTPPVLRGELVQVTPRRGR